MMCSTNLGNDEITVVQRSTVEADKNVVLADMGDGTFLTDEAIEALVLALDDPLLLSRGNRHCDDGV